MVFLDCHSPLLSTCAAEKDLKSKIVKFLKEDLNIVDPSFELNGWIVGSICLKQTDDWAQLRYLLLDERVRGIGLGKRMIELFMAFMKECGYKKSFLLTEKQLNTAANLYEKLGYRYVSSTFTDFGLEERRYELVL